MTIRVLAGDCRVTLPTLPECSVQAVITSPPYWGLRDYGTPPLIWGGQPVHEHEWNAAHTAGWHVGTSTGVRSSTLNNSAATHQSTRKAEITGRSMGDKCGCGAWLGSLGLEPRPELYVEHIVECFRHVWRVLGDDGVIWVNLGDSYAGSGKGPTGHNGIGNQERRQGFVGTSQRSHTRIPYEGFKAKDLLEIPSLVAQALRSDGWYLRSRVPWVKRAAMPESVDDRPATAVEYIFLLAKSRRYYWNADAVRMGVSGTAHARGNGVNPKAQKWPSGWDGGEGDHRQKTGRYKPRQNASFSGAVNELVTSRNRRNSDWFFESWQGLLLDEQDEPLAFMVNPAPFKGSHFATFPPKLVEPMILATCPPGGTVLDPFFGAGTVGLVADRLGRNAIGCELKPEYTEMGAARIVGESPMFVELEST